MRLVIISACDPVDCYLIAAVIARWTPIGIIRPLWVPGGEVVPQPRELRRMVRAPGRRAREEWHRRYFNRLYRQAGQALMGSAPAPVPAGVVDVPVWAMSDPETVALMKRWRPDVLLVSGAPILRPVLYSVARVRVNVHFGIAPKYRGHHTLFWPLRLGDYEHIGATIHCLENIADSGAAVARIYPDLEPADTEATLVVKCARLLAPVLVEFLDAVENAGAAPPSCASDGPPGPIIRHDDRKFRHDLLFALRRRVLRQGPPPRPARVERYF